MKSSFMAIFIPIKSKVGSIEIGAIGLVMNIKYLEESKTANAALILTSCMYLTGLSRTSIWDKQTMPLGFSFRII